MSGPNTITLRHLDRLAIVYVRQSTLTQVREHRESTARQYALAEEAARFGWPASSIVTIDTDLGLSGRSASARTGFKRGTAYFTAIPGGAEASGLRACIGA